MSVLKYFKRRGAIVLPDGDKISNFASLREIENTVKQFENLGRECCLDIGSLVSPSDIYQCVNFNALEGVDYVGDIRCCFSPGYIEHIDKYPTLSLIPKGVFRLVRLVDVIEHIEWIHQSLLFRWIHSLLAPNGLVYIKTPNLDYIVKMYFSGMEAICKNKKLTNFPFEDHPDLSSSPVGVVEWINAQLFSGCSNFTNDDGIIRGDFHHCCYNKFWLERMLTSSEAGAFVNIQVFEEARIIALAQKESYGSGVDNLVERLVG